MILFRHMVAKRSLASTLSRKIANSTFIVFLVAMITIAVVAGISNMRMASRSAVSALDSMIKDIEKILTAVESSTETMAWIMSEGKREYDPVDITSRMVVSDTSIVGCSVAYEDGRMITDRGTDTDGGFQSLEWYRIPKSMKRSYWSEPWKDESQKGGGIMVTSYSVPLIDSTGVFRGILKSDVELGWLTDKVSALRPFEDSYTILLGKEGTYMVHPITEYIYNEDIFSVALQNNSDQLLELGMKVTNGESGIMRFSYERKHMFAIYGPLRNGWSTVLLCPASEFYKDSIIINIVLFLISILGIFFYRFIIFQFYFFVYRFSRAV